jgi:hypothetical protein
MTINFTTDVGYTPYPAGLAILNTSLYQLSAGDYFWEELVEPEEPGESRGNKKQRAIVIIFIRGDYA